MKCNLFVLYFLSSMLRLEKLEAAPPVFTREQVVAETMRPYTGPTSTGVDRSTLRSKGKCGYPYWNPLHCGRASRLQKNPQGL